MDHFLIYLLLINAAAFVLMLSDKQKAKRSRWRIPEATLLGAAVVGGSPGILIGMYLCHHKTRKPAFFIGVPVILAIQIILFCLVF